MMLHFSNSQPTSLVVFLGILGFLILLSLPLEVSAQPQTFVPLTNLPLVDYTSISSFVNGFIRILFVVAALLAIGMIVWGGFLYLTTESVSGKGDAKGKISDALIGLMLLLVSVLLLTIINPDILNIRLFRNLGTTPVSTPPPSSGQSVGSSVPPPTGQGSIQYTPPPPIPPTQLPSDCRNSGGVPGYDQYGNLVCNPQPTPGETRTMISGRAAIEACQARPGSRMEPATDGSGMIVCITPGQ